MLLLTIFVIIPLIELSVFLTVGQYIGLPLTLALCFLTAGTGGLLVRQQGLDVLFKGHKALSEGFLPLEELFDGFCIVAAGVMLITPGFVTDTIGALLLVPKVRRLLRKYLSQRFRQEVMGEKEHTPHSKNYGNVIEAEYKILSDENDPKAGA